MFYLIPDGCKIVFNLENTNIFLYFFEEALKTCNEYSWKANKMECG